MFYAASGFIRDGIAKKIQAEMAKKFSDVAVPEFPSDPDSVVAYAHLNARIRFTYAFLENNEGLLFRDSSGSETPVGSFGLRAKDENKFLQQRKQVRVLVGPADDDDRRGEYALDLCRYSQPEQVVVARAQKKGTLGEIWDDVQQRSNRANARDRSLYYADMLAVPNMHWRIVHHFDGLEGRDKHLRNPPLRGLFLARAIQVIDFKLDREGAALSSEGRVQAVKGAWSYSFGRPFFIYMKKRDAQHPFFVMWVDNAELLQQR